MLGTYPNGVVAFLTPESGIIVGGCGPFVGSGLACPQLDSVAGAYFIFVGVEIGLDKIEVDAIPRDASVGTCGFHIIATILVDSGDEVRTICLARGACIVVFIPVIGAVCDIGFDINVGVVAVADDGVAMNCEGGELTNSNDGVDEGHTTDIIHDSIVVGVAMVGLIGVGEKSYTSGSFENALECGCGMVDSVVELVAVFAIEDPFMIDGALGGIAKDDGVARTEVLVGEGDNGLWCLKGSNSHSFLIPAGCVVS